MKKLAAIVFCLLILILPSLSKAESDTQGSDYSKLFDGHGAVMLLIEPQTGAILYANNAACVFYGYSKQQLESMTITQINMLDSNEVAAEMQAAVEQNRNFFVFKHKLASGDIRTVEVYSYPAEYQNQQVLFSVVFDVTKKTLLEEKESAIIAGSFITGSMVILILLVLLGLLLKSSRELKASKSELQNSYALRQTFIDADDSLVYLKDEHLNYVFVNKAFEDFYEKTANEVIGRDDFALTEEAFAQKRRNTDMAVQKEHGRIVDHVEWAGRIFRTNKFPVKMSNGKTGVGAYVRDVTAEHESEKRQEKMLYRHIILTEIMTRSFKSTQEQLDYVLHEALNLTESKYGYIYLYNEQAREFTLNSWTKGVMEDCEVADVPAKYPLDKTGIWGEVVRQRKAIINNDFRKPHPLKKGFPKGHVELERFMSVPVFIDGKIVAAVGLGNKEKDYDHNDIYEITMLMGGAWHAAERRAAQEKLALERNKYLQTLVSIGDGVMVVDRQGRIEMLNTIAEHLTGYTLGDALGRHYSEIFILTHEESGIAIKDPIKEVFETDTIHELDNHAVLTAKNGARYHLEDSAAPIKDEAGVTVGVVLVFRDVTDKKEQRRKIEYLSYHDTLTGLYNRRFFEEELLRLDQEQNLPISIVMGDVNGLKLTNDIFGHAFGDMLLQEFSEVLKDACGQNDIIARWGGDEFVLLLPGASAGQARKLVEKIKQEFGKRQIKAIKGSISMGFAVKNHPQDDIIQVLKNAEEKMYTAKTLEGDDIHKSAIDAIITTLHQNSFGEKAHSERVSALCQALGQALQLPAVDIFKLKAAGFLHDIGKVVLEPQILNKSFNLTNEEFSKIKKHTSIGYRILNSFDQTIDLAEAVLSHHEHWDGGGYPKGTKGEEIPLLGRIISVAESYDRMTRDVPNRAAMTSAQAIREIRENAGTQFDPKIAEVFAQMMASDNEA